MPKISSKAIQMPESPIRKLVPYAEKANQQGKKVHFLNIGQPDIPTPGAAIDVLKNMDLEVLAYSPANGNASYREKLVDYYRQFERY